MMNTLHNVAGEASNMAEMVKVGSVLATALDPRHRENITNGPWIATVQQGLGVQMQAHKSKTNARPVLK
eukprot:12397771-Karenia_brevis.AAC.1